MGNKPGALNKTGSVPTADLNKALPKIKVQLTKLETTIFPGQNLHYLLLDPDFESLVANSTWSELAVGQRVVNSIFSKLRLTAKLFAQTLHEPETRCIHMKGDSNIFSYYSIKDFHLVIHRTLPTFPSQVSNSNSTPSLSHSLSTRRPSTIFSHQNSGNVSSSNSSRDKSPSRNGYMNNSIVSGNQPPSPRSASSSLKDSSGLSSPSPLSISAPVPGSTNLPALYRDDENQALQVERLVLGVQELIYGPSQASSSGTDSK